MLINLTFPPINTIKVLFCVCLPQQHEARLCVSVYWGKPLTCAYILMFFTTTATVFILT